MTTKNTASPDERAAQKAKFEAALTPEHREIIDSLRDYQIQLKLSDNEFAKKHLSISYSGWSRIYNLLYTAKPDSALAKLGRDLRNLRSELSRRNKQMAGRPYIKLPDHELIFDALEVAKLREDEHRLVIYRAKSGGGKTTLLKQVQIELNGYLVEAKESWRKSYLAATSDIASAVGIKIDGDLKSEHKFETALIDGMNKKGRGVLLIDEGEYFGPRTINLIKLILNQTKWTIFLGAIPELFDRWSKKAWAEAVQLRRRTVINLTASAVTADDVKRFAAYMQLPKNAAAWIARSANEFGLYDTVARVIEQLAVEDDLDDDNVASAIAETLAQTAA